MLDSVQPPISEVARLLASNARFAFDNESERARRRARLDELRKPNIYIGRADVGRFDGSTRALVRPFAFGSHNII